MTLNKKIDDTKYIKMALDLAVKAKGETSPNPMVGAIIVKNGCIVAKGYHRRCGSDHAEIVAIKKAGNRAKGAKLYVTLEPCSHYGKTPPCVDKIIQSGIKEVVIGMKDPNPINNGKSIRRLNRVGIKTKVGFLKDELLQINEPFIKYIKTKMPFVVTKCAQTIDGKIATYTGDSKWITSKRTRDFAHYLRSNFDAILVGSSTVVKDDPYLNAPKKIKRIKKIIVDSRLRLSKDAKLFYRTKPQDIFIATTKSANKNKLRTFLRKGVNIIICPGKNGRIHLKYLFKELAKREITNILIEGGATIIGGALKEKLVDKMLIFIALKIMGDQDAISSIKGLKVKSVDCALRLKGINLYRIADDLMVEAYVCRDR